MKGPETQRDRVLRRLPADAREEALKVAADHQLSAEDPVWLMLDILLRATRAMDAAKEVASRIETAGASLVQLEKKLARMVERAPRVAESRANRIAEEAMVRAASALERRATVAPLLVGGLLAVFLILVGWTAASILLPVWVGVGLLLGGVFGVWALHQVAPTVTGFFRVWSMSGWILVLVISLIGLLRAVWP